MSKFKTPVAKALYECAATFEERNKVYGDAYKRLGDVFVGLFPHGITLTSADDFGRFGMIGEVVSKLQRYCNNFHKGGHKDSLHDISVYCQMIQELDDDKASKE